MRRKKKELQKEQQFWSTFQHINRTPDCNDIPSHLQRVNFRIWDNVNDEHIERMVSKVTSIEMLDLDETEITNAAIEHLAKLEYLGELRLKGIRQIDDACMPSLNKLSTLKLLHVGGTSITLEGLFQLTALKQLKELFFSHDGEIPADEVVRLKLLFPGCALAVNNSSI